MKYFLSIIMMCLTCLATAGTVNWSIPTSRVNGTPLLVSEIAGYEIRYKSLIETDYHTISIKSGSATQYVGTFPQNVSQGIFQIATIDTDGNYSIFVDVKINMPVAPGAPSANIPECVIASSSSSLSSIVTSSKAASSASASSSVYLTIPYTAKTVPTNPAPGLLGKYYIYRSADFGGVALTSLTQVNSSITTLQPSSTFLVTNLLYGGSNYSDYGIAGNTANLRAFIGIDAISLDKDPTTVGNAGYIRFTGMIKLTAGQYTFRVKADDGYSIRINQKVVAEYNGLQSVTTRDHPIFVIPTSGYYSIDIKFWDGGGEYLLDVKLANKADSVYKVLDKSILFNF